MTRLSRPSPEQLGGDRHCSRAVAHQDNPSLHLDRSLATGECSPRMVSTTVDGNGFERVPHPSPWAKGGGPSREADASRTS